MLVRIPPKYSVSEIVGYLKGKKFPYDLWKACEFKIQIWGLVDEILRFKQLLDDGVLTQEEF